MQLKNLRYTKMPKWIMKVESLRRRLKILRGSEETLPAKIRKRTHPTWDVVLAANYVDDARRINKLFFPGNRFSDNIGCFEVLRDDVEMDRELETDLVRLTQMESLKALNIISRTLNLMLEESAMKVIKT